MTKIDQIAESHCSHLNRCGWEDSKEEGEYGSRTSPIFYDVNESLKAFSDLVDGWLVGRSSIADREYKKELHGIIMHEFAHMIADPQLQSKGGRLKLGFSETRGIQFAYVKVGERTPLEQIQIAIAPAIYLIHPSDPMSVVENLSESFSSLSEDDRLCFGLNMEKIQNETGSNPRITPIIQQLINRFNDFHLWDD